MKDLRDLQRMAKEMQASMEKAQSQLADETVEGTAGGGAVTVVMSGTQDVKSVRISPEAVDPSDVETLQDLVLAAIKDAVKRSKDLAAAKLGGITGGLKLP
jgi:nucleoid-associated protein EbfC